MTGAAPPGDGRTSADPAAPGGAATPVVLEPMAQRHLEAVHAIEVANSPDPWSLELLADELDVGRSGPTDRARPDRLWLVAVDHRDGVVGFGGVLRLVDEAHLMNVVVSPTHRRRGLASGLVARLLLAASDRGSVAATLEVRAGNLAAVELYRGFGFEVAGHRPRYYPNGDDAAIMWLHDLHRPAVRQLLVGRAVAGPWGPTP